MATLAYLPGIDESVLRLDADARTLPECAINDPQRVGEILNVLVGRPYYAIDVETTSLDHMRGQLHGVSLAVEEKEWYVFDGATIPLIQGLVDMHYHDPKKGAIGHNLKFDLHWLTRFGYRPNFIADTMIAQNLVDENLDAGLKSLAETRLGIQGLPDFKEMLKKVATKYICKKCDNETVYDVAGTCPYCGKKLSTWKRKLDDLNILDIPLNDLILYSAKDTRLTFDLWKVLSNDLKREGMWNYFHKKSMPFLYVLLDMENSGMFIDQPLVAQLKEEFTAESSKARETFDKLSGGVNPNSSQQLADLLFNKLGLPKQYDTDSGNPSTDALVLQRLAAVDTTGTVAALRTVKMYDKLLSTYIKKFQEGVWHDGRLYGSFNQDGTVTGRLSSSDPNLQNIPSRGELGHRIREAFVAQESGNVILVADYSQLELRLVAHFSGEPRMVDAFLNGDDPHQVTADMMGVPRSIGKAQPVGAPVLTPWGWTTMGEINVGDHVVGSDGRPTQVLGVFPQGVRPVYRVTLNDGSWVECDIDHLWQVKSRYGGEYVLSVAELLETGLSAKPGGADYRWELPMVQPVQFARQDIPLDPYLVGVLIGNGSFSNHFVSVSIADEEVLSEVEQVLPEGCTIRHRENYDYYISGVGRQGTGRVGPVKAGLMNLGLMGHKSGEKFIPAAYLYNTVDVRFALLQGLLDTDGYVNKGGTVVYTTVSEQLANDVVELVQSLGGMAYKTFKPNQYQGSFNVTVRLDSMPLFRLPRKANRLRQLSRGGKRRIASIEFVGMKETQCILVAAEDHLYVTKDYIVTHNTLNFGTVYGQGPRTMCDTIEKSGKPRPKESDAKEWLVQYDVAYPVLKSWKWGQVDYAREYGYVKTIGGRKRRLPDINSYDKYLRSRAQRQSYNAPIQGSAADVAQEAMLDISPYLSWYGSRMLAQVHDELVFECPREVVHEFGKIVHDKMVGVGEKFGLKVSLEADPGAGHSWAEAKSDEAHLVF